MKKFYIIIVSISIMSFIYPENTFGQNNIAQKASKLATSYVSSWEKLSAINDGYEPKSSGDKGPGAYGNWKGETGFNKWNWVEYDFENYYLISSSAVYWWTDGGGIQIPYDTYIEFLNVFSGEWVKPQNVVGNEVLANKYNVTTFDPVVTNKIRLYCISIAAQGILEWKIFGEITEDVPLKSTVKINKALSRGETCTITATALDLNSNPVQGYKFQIKTQISNYIKVTDEKYLVKDTSISDGISYINSDLTDAKGLSNFDITVPEDIDPNDGIEVIVKLENGLAEIARFSYYAEGLVPPVLTPDNVENNVDNDIEITFNGSSEWKDKIYAIWINNFLLDSSDYKIEEGILKLKPSNGNPFLTVSGNKKIIIESLGYINATVDQYINAGSISIKNSNIDSTVKIYRPSTTVIPVYAYDKYKNPVSGYIFSYDIEVVNHSSTINEIYKVADIEISANKTDNNLTATDRKGRSTLSVKIPIDIDLNDGIFLKLKLSDNVTNVGDKTGYIRRENEKEAYIPRDIKKIKEFSWDQTAQSENFLAIWGAKSGPDPINAPSNAISFDPQAILKNLESYYSFYIDSMKFITNSDSGNMAKYKFVIILFNTWNSGYTSDGAFGGSVDEIIGAMWMNPMTGFVIAHEFGHACQAMIPIQYPGKGFKDSSAAHVVGMYWESCANYMAFLASGQLANSLSPLFINTSMLQYLSTIDSRQYESIYLPAYIIDKYGIEALGKQWRAADVGDNPFDAMMKGLSMTRNEMRREAGLWAMHNITWDYSIGEKIRNYLNSLDYSVISREYTYLDTIAGVPDIYIVPREMAPADYGYNIIPVFPDNSAKLISAKLTGYANDPAKGGGWSYGFVAVDKDGNSRYGNVSIETDEKATFQIEGNDSLFYLVVLASPQKTNTYIWTPAWPKVYRFPYALEFENVIPAGHKDGYNSKKNKVAGAPHSNGGGWVASTATVDATAYVGPNTQVLGSAKVQENAKIEDFAQVIDNAVIKGNAKVRGNAIVGKTANIIDNAVVEKSARVFGGKISGNGVITGSAVAINCKVSGNAVIKDVAWLSSNTTSGITISGTAIVGGDKINFTNCDEGVYLSLSQEKCDEKLWDTKIEDANQIVEHYYYPYGDIPLAPENLIETPLSDNSVLLKWDEAPDNEYIVNYIVFSNGKPLKLVKGICDTITDLIPETNYTFSLRARDNAGNISEVSEKVTIQTPVSSETLKVEMNGIKIIPNPVKDNFLIQINGVGNANVIISDILGRVVLNEKFTGSVNLDKDMVGGSGIYFVKVETELKTFVSKITIK